MKKYYVLFFLLSNFILLSQTSIYEIQYTEIPGSEGTYPSPLFEQYIITGGIVSGINFDTDHYFITSSTGGAWNGIYIYDNEHTPAIGDSIIVYGQIWEYHGFTEIRDISSFEIISSNNPLPLSALVNTNDINSQEAYESVLIKVEDITVFSGYNEWSEWQVDDGSGECYIGPGFFNLEEMGFPLFENYPFNSITGIVSYSWGYFLLHPRNINDFNSDPGGHIFSTNSENIYGEYNFEIPVLISFLEESANINSYQLDFEFDPEIVNYSGFDENGTLSENGTVTDQIVGNEVTIDFTGSFSFSGIEPLINLSFNALNSGDADIELLSADINEMEVSYLSSGQIGVIIENNPIGDTLTVIQRPLLNIPAIVIPGQAMEIVCLAPESTTDWSAELIHNENTLSLNINGEVFDTSRQRWFLTTIIPEPEIFELYDLKVTASGDIEDITANAVQIIHEIKNEYYFIHITDTHLPTHLFYPDEETLTDTSEIVDFREVINDINLINPEFVLFTGDLVNEGELEDFENRRYFTKAQRLMKELEVPVYLVSGNHDLGGWSDTPPPQGTARRNWWRFFGWNWLSDPPDIEPYYTQDYSFDYGSVHFVGMEAYLNYDYYMYDIYGYESFIPSQLVWLEEDLQEAAESEAKVLFYHYDFSEQIDLSDLEVDMALWGHIHSDDGNINSHPYNLATDNVCDGDRAYRLIRVNDSELDPQYTSHAGLNGENLNITFYPSNEGIADSVSAIIENQQNLDFEHAQIKFLMPNGDFDHIVQNGILEQVDPSGEFNVCYVSVNIPANSEINVSIESIPSGSDDDNEINDEMNRIQIFPNPVNSKTNINYQLNKAGKVEIEVYNLKGQLVEVLVKESQNSGFHSYDWNVHDLKSGIYFIKFNRNNLSQIRKCLVVK